MEKTLTNAVNAEQQQFVMGALAHIKEEIEDTMEDLALLSDPKFIAKLKKTKEEKAVGTLEDLKQLVD